MPRKRFLAFVLAALIGVAAVGVVLGQGTGEEGAQKPEVAQELEGTHEPEVAQEQQQEIDPAYRNLMQTFDLTLEEAKQYMAWAVQTLDVDAALSSHIPEDRLLGKRTEVKPWKFVILLSGPEPAPSALTAAAAQAPIPVEIRVNAGPPKEQLQAILEAELAERGGEGSITEGTIRLVLPPPEGLPMDQFSAVAAELEAELEAKHGAMFDVVLGYETAVLLIPPAASSHP